MMGTLTLHKLIILTRPPLSKKFQASLKIPSGKKFSFFLLFFKILLFHHRLVLTFFFLLISVWKSEAHSEPSHRSKMELFTKRLSYVHRKFTLCIPLSSSQTLMNNFWMIEFPDFYQNFSQYFFFQSFMSIAVQGVCSPRKYIQLKKFKLEKVWNKFKQNFQGCKNILSSFGSIYWLNI